MIPTLRPMMGREEEDAVLRVLRSGWIVSGPEVAAFERELAPVTGAEHNVVVASATQGLTLALVAAGIGRDDFVAIPAMTHIATADAVRHAGARPVLVDVTEGTLLFRPGHVPPAAKAVIPVDLYGNLAWSPQATVPVILDAAHTIGIRQHPRSTLATVYSFHAMKNITTGEGGCVSTNDAAFARDLRLLREHGQDRDDPKKPFLTHGFKANMSDVLAAIGRAQLPKLAGFLARRQELVFRYDTALKPLFDRQWILPVPATPASGPHLYVVRCERREAVRARLLDAGVQTVIQYPAICDLPAYKGSNHCPVASRAGHEVFSLPLWPGLTAADQATVVHALRDAVEGVFRG